MRKINYFNSKFELKSDPILSVIQIVSMDDVLTGFKHQEPDGQLREIELEDFQRAICHIQLIPTVPDEVKTVFKGAKKLFIYGFFEYYFLTISLHYLFLSVESALRRKFDELFGEKKGFTNLKSVVDSLKKAGIIEEEDFEFYVSVVELRNEMSHLTRPTIFPASKELFERVAVLINQLYDK